METLILSKADRFFPLIAHSPKDSGGSISLQNILDLQEGGMLDALRTLQHEIVHIRSQSQLLGDTLIQEPMISSFFRFVDAMHEVARAKRVKDSGEFLTVTRSNGSNVSLEPEIFYLEPIKTCLHHIQERYGRLDWDDPLDKNIAPRRGVDRIIAMTKWLLMKNHAFDYLMTFEVIKLPDSDEFKVKAPRWEGTRAIPEAERQERLLEVHGFLMECCHPGRLGVFPAADVQLNYE